MASSSKRRLKVIEDSKEDIVFKQMMTHQFDQYTGHMVTSPPIFKHYPTDKKDCYSANLVFTHQSRYDLLMLGGAHHLLFSFTMIKEWDWANLFGHQSTRNSLHIGWAYDAVKNKHELYCTIWDKKRQVKDQILIHSTDENRQVSISVVVDQVQKRYFILVNDNLVVDYHYQHNKNIIITEQEPELNYFVPYQYAVSYRVEGDYISIYTVD